MKKVLNAVVACAVALGSVSCSDRQADDSGFVSESDVREATELNRDSVKSLIERAVGDLNDERSLDEVSNMLRIAKVVLQRAREQSEVLANSVAVDALEILNSSLASDEFEDEAMDLVPGARSLANILDLGGPQEDVPQIMSYIERVRSDLDDFRLPSEVRARVAFLDPETEEIHYFNFYNDHTRNPHLAVENAVTGEIARRDNSGQYRMNGSQTPFRHLQNPDWILIGSRCRTASNSNEARVVVPVTDNLNIPSVRAAGREYIDALVNGALDELRENSVTSLAQPGRLVADLYSPEFISVFIFIEHIDANAFYEAVESDRIEGGNENIVRLFNRVLITLGANGDRSYPTCNFADACGIAQYTPVTYRSIVERYESQGFRNSLPFGSGPEDGPFVESVITQMIALHFDETLRIARVSHPDRFAYYFDDEGNITAAGMLHSVASYNTGTGNVNRAISRYGHEWIDRLPDMGRVFEEGQGYLRKFIVFYSLITSDEGFLELIPDHAVSLEVARDGADVNQGHVLTHHLGDGNNRANDSELLPVSYTSNELDDDYEVGQVIEVNGSPRLTYRGRGSFTSGFPGDDFNGVRVQSRNGEALSYEDAQRGLSELRDLGLERVVSVDSMYGATYENSIFDVIGQAAQDLGMDYSRVELFYGGSGSNPTEESVENFDGNILLAARCLVQGHCLFHCREGINRSVNTFAVANYIVSDVEITSDDIRRASEFDSTPEMVAAYRVIGVEFDNSIATGVGRGNMWNAESLLSDSERVQALRRELY